MAGSAGSKYGIISDAVPVKKALNLSRLMTKGKKNMKPEQKFVTIPAGEVEIEGELIKVESFQLSNLCVTAKEFQVWKEKIPYSTLTKPNKPATNVSWFEAKAFAEAHSCRLPTEAEWQWAAQGGKLKQTWSGTSEESALSKFAWFEDYDRGKPHRVGKLQPNIFGLYDMSGNVWEWCEDLFNKESSRRVLRGGGWFYDAPDCRSAYRLGNDPGDRYDGIGFRLVFVP